MQNKTASVTVTRDRLEGLKRTVEALRKSAVKPDEMIVVNNDSSDGTKRWLESQSDITVINQHNAGSSGGEYAGMKLAYEKGCDYIWLVEDDIVPRPDCLQKLLDHASPDTVTMPFLYHPDGRPYLHTAISYNLTNPFRSFWKEIISEKHLQNDTVKAVGITFEGPLIHRSVIEKIGLPDRNFFIYADDTEYFLRADRAGIDIKVVSKANCDRIFPLPPEGKFTWKHYYLIRNLMAVNVFYGSKPVRILRPIMYLLLWTMRAKSIADVKTVLKAFRDGYFFKPDEEARKNN